MGLERAAFAAFFFSVVVHAWVAWTTGLTGDEAHYLLYARHLDWSYFDHPPLVGWLQVPMVWLADATGLTNSSGFLRLPAQLLWIAMAWVLWNLALLLSSDRRVAAWSLILLSTSPVLQIHGMALLPDTLLCLFALVAALLCVWIRQTPKRWSLWLGLGFTLGLAGLSKYSAIFLAIGLAIYLGAGLTRSRSRPWPWKQMLAAVLLALLMVSPVFLWNAAHDWISFKYQGGHVSGSGWQLRHLALFLVVQLLVFGPAASLGLLAFVRRMGSHHSFLPVRDQMGLLSVFAVFMLVLGWLSGGGRSLPYWTSPAWVVALPFAAAGIVQLGGLMRRLNAGLAVASAALVLSLAGSLQSGTFFNLRHFDGPQPFLDNPQGKTRVLTNPLAEVHGWPELGEALLRLQAARGDSGSADSPHQLPMAVAVGNWTLGSRLGWYAWPQPVLVVDRRFDQFDLWWNGKNIEDDRPRGSQSINGSQSSSQSSDGSQATARLPPATPASRAVLFVEWSEMQTRKYRADPLRCEETPVLELKTPPQGWTSGGDLSVFRIYDCVFKPDNSGH